MALLIINDPLREIIIGISYFIQILIFQMGLLFIKQWKNGFRKQSHNRVVLSYGFYYISLAVSIFFSSFFYYQGVSNLVYQRILIISAFIRGIGGILFSINIENFIQKVLKTRYLFSILFLGALFAVPFLQNNPFFYQEFDFFNLLFISLPFIFSLFFIRNTFDEVRKKLIISLVGLVLLFLGIYFSTPTRLEWFETKFPSSSIITIIFQLVSLLGIFLFSYGVIGYSFSLELQWQNNLIAIYIIDRRSNSVLYHKDYLECEIKSEEIFAGGIAGIVKIIKDFTNSHKNLDVIHIENKSILLEFGKNIISAMLIKKNLLNAQHILKEITRMFEFYFWDYLENRDLKAAQSEIFKPMEIITRNLIKL
ncbi:MAG: hypothetical protein ACFFCM_02855 [Promethearchaeota archaeon]